MAIEFVTIPFSHYCEKARWALDRVGVTYIEHGHLPIFSRLATKRMGAGNTVPAVVADGKIVADSTAIVAWADARRPGALLPTDANERAAALALEDTFDEQLGPATRRWAYYYLLPNKAVMRNVTANGVPTWQARTFRMFRPLAAGAIKRGLKIDTAGAERSRQKIETVFAQVNALLADGRRFLVGTSFSVADLAFASLAAPILVPPQQKFGMAGPQIYAGEARAAVEAWRATPAGQFALRMFATER
ncbi:MAG TPA: glutathione S-transferase family protein [Kofleriaceae bacterium]|nr:glutathione S-transferase family protein [Kofleriaceae bacterium]